ncbi:aspartic peptidase domain-containing protein [Lanmaoa asiatica]|nr:aspartic peptidase domain-containing protein [Lanmaoa asiatica]
MRFTFATSIAALVVLTTAAPQLPLGQKAGVAIPLHKHSGFVDTDKSVEWTTPKILRGFENAEKNTGASRSAALKGIQRRVNASVPVVRGGTWYGTISVGTPPKEFTVDRRLTLSGSALRHWVKACLRSPVYASVFAKQDFSDLFLPAPSCRANCASHTIYDPRNSSTSRSLKKPFSLGYEDGDDVKGRQVTDTVTLGGLKAVTQTLGVATHYSAGFNISEFPADGIMGMAYESLSNYPARPVFQSLVAQNRGLASVFSFKLAAVESELYLGGANPDLYTGSFSYVPVDAAFRRYWAVKMDRIQSNGETILNDRAISIIDTGANVVVGNSSQVATLHAALGGTPAGQQRGFQRYSFPCDSFPNVSFTFGGTPFPISAATLNIGRVDGDLTRCYSGIVAKNMGDSAHWIIGAVFLQNVYTTFDFDRNRVGFAHLA